MKNFVYVIGAPEGPQKLGIAVDVKKRLQGIQTGSHIPVVLASAEVVDAEIAVHVENYAHWILREHRLSGEWFRVTPEQAGQAVREAIEAVTRGERKERAKRAKVGRPRLWAEDMQARFPEGTFEQIDAVLEEGETRTDFVRIAVEMELQKREKAKKRRS